MDTPAIDWWVLLVKYVRHVGASEGATFIDSYYRHTSDVPFTDEEWAALEVIDEQAPADASPRRADVVAGDTIMSDAAECHCDYGKYFVVLKDRTAEDWFVVVKLDGTVVNGDQPFVIAGNEQDAKNQTDAYMLRHFRVTRTSAWKESRTG